MRSGNYRPRDDDFGNLNDAVQRHVLILGNVIVNGNKTICVLSKMFIPSKIAYANDGVRVCEPEMLESPGQRLGKRDRCFDL